MGIPGMDEEILQGSLQQIKHLDREENCLAILFFSTYTYRQHVSKGGYSYEGNRFSNFCKRTEEEL